MRAFPLVLLAAALSPAAARAHRLDVAVTVAGPAVRVVVGYDDRTPADRAAVTLATAGGEVVAAGTTDANGVCELPRPPAGTYTVTADDRAGHAATTNPFTVPESDDVSSGTPTRNRWLMTAAGLAVIAALTVALRRARATRPAAGSPPARRG